MLTTQLLMPVKPDVTKCSEMLQDH